MWFRIGIPGLLDLSFPDLHSHAIVYQSPAYSSSQSTSRSMFRFVFTVLMALQVLACPFMGCDECKGASSVETAVVSSGCHCCQEQGSCPAPEPPVNSDGCPDCNFCNCFCAGAVQPEIVRSPEASVFDLHDSWLVGAFLPEPSSSTVTTLWQPRSVHSPPSSRGRSVHARTECWLL